MNSLPAGGAVFLDKVTILTSSYMCRLSTWATNLNEKIKEGYTENNYYVTVNIKKETAAHIIDLLEDFLLYKNPITKENEVMYRHMKNKILKSFREELLEGLEIFLKNETNLSLEGYVDFRMDKYAHIVNVALYAIIKKSL